VQDSTPRAETRLIAEGEARRITDCFATLEPDRAAAVRGAYLTGLSYIELAARHAVPLNTMRTWLRRSLLKLKECLEQ
jgi:RNA polymerase sigma-70 factor, ECF subfamily